MSTHYWKAVVLTAMLILVFSGCRKDPVEPANNPPYMPGNPFPANYARDVDLPGHRKVILSWSGGGPDAGDVVRYDVFWKGIIGG